jgi:hypothetical protein
MRKIRLLMDSAIHPAGTELSIVGDDVGVHAMDAVVLAHAIDLIEREEAEPVVDPAPGFAVPSP